MAVLHAKVKAIPHAHKNSGLDGMRKEHGL